MTLSFYGPILGEFKGCTAFVPPSMVNSFCGFDFSCHLCPKEKADGLPYRLLLAREQYLTLYLFTKR